jgi:hypothetical protein
MSRMDRRTAIKSLLGAGAAATLALGSGGCGAQSAMVGTSARRGTARLDTAFARIVIGSAGDVTNRERSELLAHPALHAIVRHRRMSGNGGATPEATLALVLDSVRRERPGSEALDAWLGREHEIGELVDAAAAFLPPDSAFDGTAFLVAGYDIGFAAPPDIGLNVAHAHFRETPSEVGFYAAHEAHHVGFMRLRPIPEMARLDDPAHLREIVRGMTQMEGMAVHAAYDLRVRRGRLSDDGDYAIYADATEARRVTARYAEILAMASASTNLPDQTIGTVLNAMSSGERLWYRFGALVSWTLERANGRAGLVASIANPEAFHAAADDLLRAVIG